MTEHTPPEYLESGSPGLPPPTPNARSSRSRSWGRGLVAGGTLVGLAAVGTGAFFGWQAFFATGPQPAQALPAATIGYVSIDLDPSGSQKIAALRTLNKLPAFKDEVGIGSGDDLRKRIFEAVLDDGTCPDVSYADDIEPWLGNRLAVAAVDLGEKSDGGHPGVEPVFVVQVKDDDAADAGLTKLKDCATDSQGSGSDVGGWAVDGDWAVIAATEAKAKQVHDETADASLADDADFQHWTGEAGDSGILTAYAAPSAGDYLASALSELSGFGQSADTITTCSSAGVVYGSGDTTTSSGVSALPAISPDQDESCSTTDCLAACFDSTYSGSTDQLSEMFKDFDGAAVTVRFGSGSLEIESASSSGGTLTPGGTAVTGTDRGGDVVETLPSGTAAAVGLGLESGWFTQLVDSFAQVSGEQADVNQLTQEAEDATGLDLPDDAETLLGSSVALALDGSFDPDALDSGDLSRLPAALKVQGDPEAVEGVLNKLRANPDLPGDAAQLLGDDASGDQVAIGPDADYRAEVVKDGGLGSTATYRDVVPDSDRAASVFFVDFDAGDWLTKVAGDIAGESEVDIDVVANLEPLHALGLADWRDGDTGHSLLRLTTD